MKRLLLVLFSLLSITASAPDLKLMVIIDSEPIKPYDKLIGAIVQVESLGDTLALNVTEEAYGAFQIRSIRLLDYNRRTGKKYQLKDCFDFEVSKQIFMYYASRSRYTDCESVARRWNGSGKMTFVYWEKVKACF